MDAVCEEVKDDTELCVKNCANSAVFSSLPIAIKWLRDYVQQNQSIRFQVVLFSCWRTLHVEYYITCLDTHGHSWFLSIVAILECTYA